VNVPDRSMGEGSPSFGGSRRSGELGFSAFGIDKRLEVRRNHSFVLRPEMNPESVPLCRG
jgi:hypothetical protein